MEVVVMVKAKIIDGCNVNDIVKVDLMGCEDTEVVSVRPIMTSEEKESYEKIIDRAFKSVSAASGLSIELIQSKSQRRERVSARYAVMKILSQKTPLSLKSIGSCFLSDFDHTTVIHGLRTVNDLMETDNEKFKPLAYAIKEF